MVPFLTPCVLDNDVGYIMMKQLMHCVCMNISLDKIIFKILVYQCKKCFKIKNNMYWLSWKWCIVWTWFSIFWLQLKMLFYLCLISFCKHWYSCTFDLFSKHSILVCILISLQVVDYTWIWISNDFTLIKFNISNY